MSNLENLVSKIKQNGDDRARQIIRNAEEKAAAVIDEKLKEADKIKSNILAESAEEAKTLKRRMMSDKSLDIRDKKIAAKREAIEKVLAEAVRRLNDMPEAEFIKFAVSRLERFEESELNAEIILPAKHKNTLDGIVNALKAKGKNAALKPYSGARVINGGFVLISGGVMQNETFDALAEYRRDELEADVMRNLF